MLQRTLGIMKKKPTGLQKSDPHKSYSNSTSFEVQTGLVGVRLTGVKFPEPIYEGARCLYHMFPNDYMKLLLKGLSFHWGKFYHHMSMGYRDCSGVGEHGVRPALPGVFQAGRASARGAVCWTMCGHVVRAEGRARVSKKNSLVDLSVFGIPKCFPTTRRKDLGT